MEGIRRNGRQIALLAVLAAFTGGMVGIERTLATLVARNVFAIASALAALSFLVTFGLAKGFSNLAAGRLADRYGRRRVLVAGWLLALPVPLTVIFAPSWPYVVAANALLGVSQALAWSMALNMKIDLAGASRRGFAVGLNESLGYAGVAASAYVAAVLAAEHGLRPVPFLVTTGLAIAGLALSLLARETAAPRAGATLATPARLGAALRRGLATDPALAAASFGGFATNLKDGLIWGLLPLLLAARGVGLPGIGFVVALYPLVWALSQLATGPLSDRVGRKVLIVPGFLVQALGLGVLVVGTDYASSIVAAIVLGVGTGMVYPTLIAYVSDASLPWERATSIGVYRFLRDLGYVGGAVVGGVLADRVGVEFAIGSGAVFALVAATLLAVSRVSTTRPATVPARNPVAEE
jgi:MFS family permease